MRLKFGPDITKQVAIHMMIMKVDLSVFGKVLCSAGDDIESVCVMSERS